MNPEWKEIDDLKAEWDRLQPLSPENHSRLWKKFRLEWNYNSNHIEGNTLTYGETELLLLHGATSGDHQLRDYEEMKAHDVAIGYVEELAQDKTRLLRESDIRDLNRIILKESFWKSAITADGEQTRKEIRPGEYKNLPNNVRTQTGEIFPFAAPEETPARMQEFVAWMRDELKLRSMPLTEFLAKLHHDLVLIHPFDDGNGRVTRLVLNYILLRLGYPPIIIKSEDKANYLGALHKADVGDLSLLGKYLGSRLRWSLEIGIRAAKGEEIEEPTDVEKELSIFIRDQKKRDPVTFRSSRVLQELYQISWRDLCEKFEQKMSQLYPLFTEHAVGKPNSKVNWREEFLSICRNSGTGYSLIIHLMGYTGNAPFPFNTVVTLSFKFHELGYSVTVNNKQRKHSYSEPILSEEANMIAVEALKAAFEEIKRVSGRSK